MKTNNIEEIQREKKITKRQKETIPVDIRRNIYGMLEGAAKDRNQSSIRQFVNYILEAFLEKEKFIDKLYFNMELYAVGKSSLFIRSYYYNAEDKSKDKFYEAPTAEIKLIDGVDKNNLENKLYCSVDDSSDCRHIHFALCLPEIHVLLNALPGAVLIDDRGAAVDSNTRGTKLIIPLSEAQHLILSPGFELNDARRQGYNYVIPGEPKKEYFIPAHLVDGIQELMKSDKVFHGINLISDKSGTIVGYEASTADEVKKFEERRQMSKQQLQQQK